MPAIVLAALTALAAVGGGCSGLERPVPGPVVRPFAPEGRFAGHWGVDLATAPGTPVRAAAPGVVTFAASVAGRRSVTLDHGGGLRTSYSYLSSVATTLGERVARGEVVGASGHDRGVAALHWSVRLGARYVDPMALLRCGEAPAAGLWLLSKRGSSLGGAYAFGVQRGILGGTFDPPHIAHLLAGEAAYRDLELDVVDFIPAGAPWQKSGRQVSSAEHRWQMTRLAVTGVEYFAADDREVRRPGWTYTIDTLDSLAPDDDITLILGADAARGLPSWHRAVDIVARARVAVLPRPGVDRAEVNEALPAAVWLDAPSIKVSGTMIRRRVAAGRSVRFLVPEAVRDYLAEHSLYQEG